ncbi:hypothetical protein [Streptomyces atriruber]|uniref:hypothetical protein n=1 Tax=Streptomyces atriruber TaxID=545121 RepID=UPI0006E17F35|nr:hypothetical protein [Streptomyces atriruber]
MTAVDERMVQRMLDGRAASAFVKGVARMVEACPHPRGRTLRVTVTAVDGGEEFGAVEVDVTNLWELGMRAGWRADNPPPALKRLRHLRVVRPGQ